MNKDFKNSSSGDNNFAIVVKNLSKRFSNSSTQALLKGLTGKIKKKKVISMHLTIFLSRLKKANLSGF